jgi:hypothetical protein
MKECRNCITGEICTEMDFRKKIINQSFPLLIPKEELLKYGYEPILDSPKPVVSKNQIVLKDGTVKDANGNWIYKWKIVNIPKEIVLAKLKAKQNEVWNNIQLMREKISNGGTLVSDKWFHTDNDSLTKYLSLMIAGDNIPPNILWKTMDGSKVLMTSQLIRDIYNAVMIFNTVVFYHAEFLKDQMLIIEDPESFDINAGWPSVFSKP